MKQNKKHRKKIVPTEFIGKTYLDPKYDPAFKAFFDSEDTLRNFLNAILQLKGKNRIRNISYRTEHEVVFRTPHKKTLKFDIYAATASHRFFDIEMQLADDTFFVDRTILNKAFLIIKAKTLMDKSKKIKALSKTEQRKRRYELPETISIWLCDFDLPRNNGDFLDEWAIYSKNDVKAGAAIPLSIKNRYIMVSLPHFNKIKSELKNDLDKWLYLLNNAGQCNQLPEFGKIYSEALERIKVDNADSELLKAQEKNMSCTKETFEIIMAGKIVDAMEKDRLKIAHRLFDMGKLSNDEISEVSGVAASKIRRWKRKV